MIWGARDCKDEPRTTRARGCCRLQEAPASFHLGHMEGGYMKGECMDGEYMMGGYMKGGHMKGGCTKGGYMMGVYLKGGYMKCITNLGAA